MNSSRAQIYAAIIVALVSLAIAAGGFLHTSGQVEAHLADMERRQTRMETQLDDIQEHVHRIDLRLVGIEASGNAMHRPSALREETLP